MKETSSVSLGINHFYRRQTADSKYSYFDGSDQELINVVLQNFPLREEGYRSGSFMVPIATTLGGKHKVFTPVVSVTKHDFLNAEVISHSKKDIPLICPSVVARKAPAEFAKVCVYSHESLVKMGEHSSKADYEIVSLIGSDVSDQPEHPYEIARRVLSEGAVYTSQQICEAILYWGSHAYCKTHFTWHVNREIADLLRKGDAAGAVKRRSEQISGESARDSTHYVESLYQFMQITRTLRVPPD